MLLGFLSQVALLAQTELEIRVTGHNATSACESGVSIASNEHKSKFLARIHPGILWRGSTEGCGCNRFPIPYPPDWSNLFYVYWDMGLTRKEDCRANRNDWILFETGCLFFLSALTAL